MITVGSPRILVVDDDDQLAAAVVRVLRGAGLEPQRVASAAAARACLAAAAFDAALIDINMPGESGIELVKSIRADDHTARLPVIFLTGSIDETTLETAMAAGGDDYLVKPPRRRELLARVRAAAQRYRLIRDLDDAEAILMSLALSVEAKDGTTAGHCQRLSHYSVVLGRALGLPDADLQALRRGGFLHDLGKIGIPDAVLLKPGKLDEAEWAVMRRHVRIGAALLAPLRTMERTLPIVRYHHERYDGSGYLEGLRGEDIPLLARVFQVVDVYDALTNVRPYKPALTADNALGIIEAETGKGWWDPRITGIFVDLVRRTPELLDLPVAPAVMPAFTACGGC